MIALLLRAGALRSAHVCYRIRTFRNEEHVNVEEILVSSKLVQFQQVTSRHDLGADGSNPE